MKQATLELFFLLRRDGPDWRVAASGPHYVLAERAASSAAYKCLVLNENMWAMISTHQRVTVARQVGEALLFKEVYRPMWSHVPHQDSLVPLNAEGKPSQQTENVHDSGAPPSTISRYQAGADTTMLLYKDRLWLSGRVPSVVVVEHESNPSFEITWTSSGNRIVEPLPIKLKEYPLPSGNSYVGFLMPVVLEGLPGVVAVSGGFGSTYPIGESDRTVGRAYLVLPSKEWVAGLRLTDAAQEFVSSLHPMPLGSYAHRTQFMYDSDAIHPAPLPGRPNRAIARFCNSDYLFEVELLGE